MPTIITHAFSAIVLSKACLDKPSIKFIKIAILCSLLPNIDVIGSLYGVNPLGFIGHRGFTHSLVFALIIGLPVILLFFKEIPRFSPKWWKYAILLSIITASHGLFDAMSSGGDGVAFFSPFDNSRYFLPWTQVPMPMVNFWEFFSKKGIYLMSSEFVYLWLPMFVFLLVATKCNTKSIKKAINGKEKLWIVILGWGIIGNSMMLFAYNTLVYSFFRMHYGNAASIEAANILVIVCLLYYLFSVVLIYRTINQRIQNVFVRVISNITIVLFSLSIAISML